MLSDQSMVIQWCRYAVGDGCSSMLSDQSVVTDPDSTCSIYPEVLTQKDRLYLCRK